MRHRDSHTKNIRIHTLTAVVFFPAYVNTADEDKAREGSRRDDVNDDDQSGFDPFVVPVVKDFFFTSTSTSSFSIFIKLETKLNFN